MLFQKKKNLLNLKGLTINCKDVERIPNTTSITFDNIGGNNMMTKTIKISEKTHKSLSELASKNETFNDVIDFLINYYYENEEFSDEQAEDYNKDIENFENDNLENVSEVTLKDLEKRISKLENELK